MKIKLSALIKLSAAFAIITIATAGACFASGIQSGAYVSDGNLAQFESLAGNPVDIQAIFVGWGSNGEFPAEYKSELADKGKTLLIYWEPSVDHDSIISGNWDGYLASFAAAAKNYGGPVILAPFAEMNGNWDIWDGTVGDNTPQKTVDSWRHVHNFFAGVSNVKFALALNNVSEPDTANNAITAYYPGDAYVDYVGLDGFNFNDPWQTWQETFASAINVIRQYNKPIYIFSTASCPGSGKAQWITDMSAGLKQYGISGWVWFNENKECDWRINSDAASLAAFKAMMAEASTAPTAPSVNADTTVDSTPSQTTDPTDTASANDSGSTDQTNGTNDSDSDNSVTDSSDQTSSAETDYSHYRKYCYHAYHFRHWHKY